MESSRGATKVCPDCAEEVLEAARKCRSCSYRFDTAPPPQPNTLVGLIRRSKSSLTLSGQIAEWGIALAPGEQVETLDLCQIKSEPGYVIITDRRLLFVPTPNPNCRPYDAFWFGELTGVAVRHRRVRPSELVLEMPAALVVVLGLGSDRLARLRAVLMASISADVLRDASPNTTADLE